VNKHSFVARADFPVTEAQRGDGVFHEAGNACRRRALFRPDRS
jgi:hypothetical protein